MKAFEFQARTRVIFGEGALARLGPLAAEFGMHRVLLVADTGMSAAGYVAQATCELEKAGAGVVLFQDFSENPDSGAVERGRAFAATQKVDSLVGLGGGSSLDCAKGINFVLTSGGRMQDYWGYAKATQPMLPMIGIPTTTGTGSEAQSYALISDAVTKRKMACGDPQAAFRAAILDPRLAVSQPRAVLAAAGYDAISHAVETFVTTAHTPISDGLSREAWRLLEGNFELALGEPRKIEPVAAMQIGAYLAGAAIEASMLGATHACANPLTAKYGTLHGRAIALMLPHVVRWNGCNRYAELMHLIGRSGGAEQLAERLEQLAAAAGLATRLSLAGVPQSDLPLLAADAAEQWTGKFNPRPFDQRAALEVYQCAY